MCLNYLAAAHFSATAKHTARRGTARSGQVRFAMLSCTVHWPALCRAIRCCAIQCCVGMTLCFKSYSVLFFTVLCWLSCAALCRAGFYCAALCSTSCAVTSYIYSDHSTSKSDQKMAIFLATLQLLSCHRFGATMLRLCRVYLLCFPRFESLVVAACKLLHCRPSNWDISQQPRPYGHHTILPS